MKSSSNKNLGNVLKNKKFAIIEVITKHKETALQITSRSRMREMLEKYNNNEIDLKTLVSDTKPKMLDAMNSSAFVVGVARFDLNNKMVFEVGLPIPEQYLLSRDSNVNDLIIYNPVKINGKIHLVIAAPIFNRKKERQGTDISLFKLTNLEKIVRDSTGVGLTGETILFTKDSQGKLNFFFDLRELGKTIEHVEQEKTILKDNIGARAKPSRDEITILDLKEGDDVIAYSFIKYPPWTILVRIEKAELYAPMKREILFLSTTVLVFVALGIFGMVLLLRPLTGKIIIHASHLEREIQERQIVEKELQYINEELVAANEELNSMNQELTSSEVDLREAQRIAHLGSWSWDIATGNITWSDEVYRIFGFKPREFPANLDFFIGKIHPDDRGFVQDSINATLTEKKLYKINYRIILPNNDEKILSARGAVSYDEAGNAINMTGTVQDITELKRAEEELKASEKKYMTLFDNSTDAIYIVNSDGNFIEVNDVASSTLGYTKEELLSMTPEDLERQPMMDVFENVFARVKEEGLVVVERVHIRKDGKKIPVEVRNRVVEYNGTPALMALVHDISVRKQTENERRKDYMNRIGVMIVAINSNGSIDFINQSGCDFLGYDREQLIGENWFGKILPEACKDGEECAFCNIIYSDDKTEENFENEVKLKSGEVRIVKWNSVPVLDDTGSLTGAICTGEDVTELKKAEEEKKKLWEQLLQSQKLESVGRLTGGIAHDFNNLLQTTIGFSTLVRDGMADDDPKKDMIDRICKSGERAAKLINQLLIFSRKQVLDIKVIDPTVAIENVLDMCIRMVGADVTIEADLGHSIDKIMADETQIEQVLMNLIVNARDAMPVGGKINIKCKDIKLDKESITRYPGLSEGKYVEISVKDTGHGMDSGIMENIFDPFFTTKGEGKGTGLGLSTVFGIVEQHNGAIYVESKINTGTEFRVCFPVTEEGVTTTREEACKLSSGSETILLVEDDPDVMLLFAATLKAKGYSIIEADTAEKALKVSDTYDGEIGLLVSDVILPGLDGFELHKKIIKARPGIKAVFVSGFVANPEVLRTLQNYNLPYMKKPIAPKEFANKIRQVLDAS